METLATLTDLLNRRYCEDYLKEVLALGRTLEEVEQSIEEMFPKLGVPSGVKVSINRDTHRVSLYVRAVVV